MSPAILTAGRRLFMAAAAAASITAAAAGAPAPLPALIIAAGVGGVWVISGTWAKVHRWGVRAQATTAGSALAVLTVAQQSDLFATGALIAFTVLSLLLWVLHTTSQALAVIRGSLTTINGFARVEGWRVALHCATYAATLVLILAPNVVGAIFLSVVCSIGYTTGALRARRRLLQGIAREVELDA